MGREHPLQGPSFGTSAEQGRRVAAFCRAYGPDLAGPEVLDVVPDRLQALIDFMREQAAQRHEAFRRHVAEGHADLYAGDEVRRPGPGPRGTGPGLVLRTGEDASRSERPFLAAVADAFGVHPPRRALTHGRLHTFVTRSCTRPSAEGDRAVR